MPLRRAALKSVLLRAQLLLTVLFTDGAFPSYSRIAHGRGAGHRSKHCDNAMQEFIWTSTMDIKGCYLSGLVALLYCTFSQTYMSNCTSTSSKASTRGRREGTESRKVKLLQSFCARDRLGKTFKLLQSIHFELPQGQRMNMPPSLR